MTVLIIVEHFSLQDGHVNYVNIWRLDYKF